MTRAESIQAIVAPTSVKRRYEHIFISAMAGSILVSVLVGFAQTYYLHGILGVPSFKAVLAPPFPVIVHMHAVLFSSWIFLLIMQTSLITAHHLDLHRRLGLIGFGLACLMVPVTLAAICTEVARLPIPSLPWGQLADITVFSTLICFAYRQRRNPAVHKRLVLIATITLLDAPFARWPVFVVGNGDLANICCYFLFLLIAAYDMLSMGRVHRATLWGAVFSIVSKYPVSYLLLPYVPGRWLMHYMQVLGRTLL